VNKLDVGEPERASTSGMSLIRSARLTRQSSIWLPLLEPERKQHRLKAGKAHVRRDSCLSRHLA
jgi:hypothetical protein